MDRTKLAAVLVAFGVASAALEASASACLRNGECGGTTPVCAKPLAGAPGTCVACGRDANLVGTLLADACPVTAPVCVTSGTSKGSCVECTPQKTGACTGSTSLPVCVGGLNVCGCTNDDDCGSGSVCDTSTGAGKCVVGCRDAQVLGHGCLVGAHCSVALVGGIGICIADTAPTCTQDSNCASGFVCDKAGDGGTSCVVGCHATAAGDSCASGTHCSEKSGKLGSCQADPVPPPDGGTFVCTNDAQCASGAICNVAVGGVGGACEKGCHVSVLGGDSCLVGAHCSVVDGTLGTCLPGSVSDAGVEAGVDAGALDAGRDATAAEDAGEGSADGGAPNDAAVPADATPGNDGGGVSVDGSADVSADGSLGGGGGCTMAPATGAGFGQAWLGVLGALGVLGSRARRRSR